MVSETCKFCEGTGAAWTLLEKTLDGDWVPNTMLSHDIADAWIRADEFAPLKWQECECPVCHGAGQYDLEFPVCKIF